ncbi:Hypothetical protein Bdt_1428 [Bdellovibrio bacteriovorus str. Tiberius]|uniref:Uncharacterized protein n=1 Tax=Bdellovibrio bacteriovorus str. Tiberius TaxID=1069642 RepID=K7YMT2_BDEBC|nr:Hypothetical protein Bdt_1428 [Bdellovibrio bacteriovorus str. Tiberius]
MDKAALRRTSAECPIKKGPTTNELPTGFTGGKSARKDKATK